MEYPWRLAAQEALSDCPTAFSSALLHLQQPTDQRAPEGEFGRLRCLQLVALQEHDFGPARQVRALPPLRLEDVPLPCEERSMLPALLASHNEKEFKDKVIYWSTKKKSTPGSP
jgi:hypothetical protein